MHVWLGSCAMLWCERVQDRQAVQALRQAFEAHQQRHNPPLCTTRAKVAHRSHRHHPSATPTAK